MVLRGHRPLSDVCEHLLTKWSSILPAGSKVDILVEPKPEPTATIDRIFESIGNPETFRIAYKLLVPCLLPAAVRESTISRLFNSDSCSLNATLQNFPLNDSCSNILPISCDDATDGILEANRTEQSDLSDHLDDELHSTRGAFASIFQQS